MPRFGIRISQACARELSIAGHEILHDRETGFWVITDGLDRDTVTYHVRVTGDEVEEIPHDATPHTFEITLQEASELFEIPYSTLAEWARMGKLDARRSGSVWLTTGEAIKKALEKKGDK